MKNRKLVSVLTFIVLAIFLGFSIWAAIIYGQFSYGALAEFALFVCAICYSLYGWRKRDRIFYRTFYISYLFYIAAMLRTIAAIKFNSIAIISVYSLTILPITLLGFQKDMKKGISLSLIAIPFIINVAALIQALFTGNLLTIVNFATSTLSTVVAYLITTGKYINKTARRTE